LNRLYWWSLGEQRLKRLNLVSKLQGEGKDDQFHSD
jgi:hypothetical protein